MFSSATTDHQSSSDTASMQSEESGRSPNSVGSDDESLSSTDESDGSNSVEAMSNDDTDPSAGSNNSTSVRMMETTEEESEEEKEEEQATTSQVPELQGPMKPFGKFSKGMNGRQKKWVNIALQRDQIAQQQNKRVNKRNQELENRCNKLIAKYRRERQKNPKVKIYR